MKKVKFKPDRKDRKIVYADSKKVLEIGKQVLIDYKEVFEALRKAGD